MTRHTLMGKRYTSIVLQHKWKGFFFIDRPVFMPIKEKERATTAL